MLEIPELKWKRVHCKICGCSRMVPEPESIGVIMQRALGMNQKEFSENLGVSGNSVWRWINQGTVPDEPSVQAMCRLADIDRPE